jgi:hypothetical protein
MVRRIVHTAFNIIPPVNIMNLFRNWLVGVSKDENVLIRVGGCAPLWDVWNIMIDYIFNNAKSTSLMQVIPLATH